ncbi:MAG: hypothetical protein A3D87_08735 [Omnitrophica WOR_2 bacterium RIFCSPHIGHO2_02_FULL_50_17]|nr:MAG: hypothetical protein A3D87_08735 [Omnitrophica WOR_2 bacterium RIFCSPHIGHO2_02_FULL_50_17]
MSPKLKEALEIHRITSPINESDLIFVNKEGNPLDPDNIIKREFQPALRMAGLRTIRFHDLRHTYTSLLIAQGENIKFIQSQLGHASIQTTRDRYGHILPIPTAALGRGWISWCLGRRYWTYNYILETQPITMDLTLSVLPKIFY